MASGKQRPSRQQSAAEKGCYPYPECRGSASQAWTFPRRVLQVQSPFRARAGEARVAGQLRLLALLCRPMLLLSFWEG